MKKLCFALVGAMLFAAIPLSGIITQADAAPQINDVSSAATGTIANWAVNHWANDSLVWAKNEGVLSKIGEDNPEPESSVTRAEFVEMTIAAMKLTPESATVKWLKHVDKLKEASGDLNAHDIAKSESLEIAMNFGLIQKGDYDDGRYNPDDDITRYDASVIVSRMAGLVYPASQNDGSSLKFKDAVADGQKGTVAELTDKKILLGYDDGYVRTDRNLTIAEACALLKRAVEYTEQGIDRSIKATVYEGCLYHDWSIYVDKYSRVIPVNTDLPLQVIDDVIYIPYVPYLSIDLHRALAKWIPEEQKLIARRIITNKTFQIGNTDSIAYIEDLSSRDTDLPLFKECRIMRGELMMPIYDIKNDEGVHNVNKSLVQDTLFIAEYDSNTKQLALYLADGKFVTS